MKSALLSQAAQSNCNSVSPLTTASWPSQLTWVVRTVPLVPVRDGVTRIQ
jgi:hypothetical protein